MGLTHLKGGPGGGGGVEDPGSSLARINSGERCSDLGAGRWLSVCPPGQIRLMGPP